MKFAKRMDRFGEGVFSKLAEIKKRKLEAGEQVIDLSIGAPNIPPVERIRKILSEEAMKPENYIYAISDQKALLEAVSDWYQRRYGVTLDPETEVCSLLGSQEGLSHIAMTIVDDGDLVLVPDPCYPVFAAGSLMAGAVPYYYPLVAEHDFLPYVKGIPEEVAKKAKYMVVSLPSNPVGSIATPGLYEEIVEFAKKYDILIIHDNAYSDIIFDGAFGGSFLATPGAKEIGVEFFSLSKSFNVTGARLSFLVGRPDVIAALRKLRSQIDFGMFLPLQKAAIAALEGPLDSVKEQCQMYQERRDALCQGLRDIGWELPNGKGTMFVWAKIPGGRTDSMAFCMELMEKAGVIVTPGASFGPHGEGYVRFALVLPPEKIREAVEAIGKSEITVTVTK